MTPREPLDPAEFEDFVSSLYLAMIRVDRPTLRRLTEEGYDDTDVRRGARVLETRGLVRSAGQAAWEVIPPDVALPRLAATLETQARVTRASASELGVLWRQSRGEDRSIGGIELLASTAEVVQAMQVIHDQARGRLSAVLDDSPAAREFLLAAAERPSEEQGAGTVSWVVSVGLLEDSQLFGVLERAAESGTVVQMMPGVAFGAMVGDDNVSVIDLSSYGPDGAGSFLVRRSPAIRALTVLIETAERMATPLRPSSESSGVPLSARDQRVLSLLATGATDQMIARHLGVSIRTVERRVRALMDSVGAETRFQAGVLAARRGWI